MSEQAKNAGTQKVGLVQEIGALLKGNIREYAMYIVLVAIIAIFSFMTDGLFVSSRNISNLINQTGYIAVLAVGMTLILIIKQIDLSVGFVCGFLGAVAAILMTKAGISEWVTIPIILVFGIVIGLFYGFLVAKVGVPAFVATLAGQLVFRGLLLLVTESSGTIIIPNEGFNAIGNGFIPDLFGGSGVHILTLVIGAVGILAFVYSQIKTRRNLKKYNFAIISEPIFLAKLVFISVIIAGIVWILATYNGLSWTVVIVAVVVYIYNFMMNKTTFGRYVYGIGGNAEAAELSGVNVVKITSIVFASMGLLAALAGVLFTSRLQSATTVAGNGFELDAIASAYIGGVSANGGIGKVTGSIIGAFVMSSLSSGMNLMGVGISYQYVIRGAILVLAVVFDVMTRKAKK